MEEKNKRDGDIDGYRQSKNTFDAVIKAASAVIFVISIAKFRWNIASIKNKDFFRSERMMILHASLFILFILAYICLIISNMVFNRSSTDGSQRYVSQEFCRSTIAVQVF